MLFKDDPPASVGLFEKKLAEAAEVVVYRWTLVP